MNKAVRNKMLSHSQFFWCWERTVTQLKNTGSSHVMVLASAVLKNKGVSFTYYKDKKKLLQCEGAWTHMLCYCCKSNDWHQTGLKAVVAFSVFAALLSVDDQPHCGRLVLNFPLRGIRGHIRKLTVC